MRGGEASALQFSADDKASLLPGSASCAPSPIAWPMKKLSLTSDISPATDQRSIADSTSLRSSRIIRALPSRTSARGADRSMKSLQPNCVVRVSRSSSNRAFNPLIITRLDSPTRRESLAVSRSGVKALFA